MTGFARLLLVLTGLAPIAVVQGAVEWGNGNRTLWIAAGAIAVILVAWCVALLRGVATSVAPVPKKIEAPAAQSNAPIGFLVAYALPLVSTGSEPSSRLGLVAFAMMMGLVVWQEQLFQINPLLAILGYKFFSAKVENDAHILILTRKRVLGSGIMPLAQISDYLWIDVETAAK